MWRVVVLAVLILAGDSLTISVYPRVVMAGQAVRVTCHVPLLPESSQDTLEIGVEGYRTSVFEVHGTPWTKEVTFDKVPCDVDGVFCALVLDKDTRIVRQPIIVAGCDR